MLYLPRLGIFNHLEHPFSVRQIRSRNTLVAVNAREFPVGICLDPLREVIDLQLIG